MLSVIIQMLKLLNPNQCFIQFFLFKKKKKNENIQKLLHQIPQNKILSLLVLFCQLRFGNSNSNYLKIQTQHENWSNFLHDTNFQHFFSILNQTIFSLTFLLIFFHLLYIFVINFFCFLFCILVSNHDFRINKQY